MSNSSFEHEYNKKGDSNNKNHLVIKIAAGVIVCIIAIAIASIAVSIMIESLGEVNPSSEIDIDSLTTQIVPEKIPSLSDGVADAKKSISHLSGIFSNVIKNP